MISPTGEFLTRLTERSNDPLLRSCTGTVRFDLKRAKETEHWYLTIDRGAVTVEQRDGEADCWVAADGALFDEIAAGRTNMMAALLRGAVTLGGELELLMSFQRLLPSPPRQQKEPVAGGAR